MIDAADIAHLCRRAGFGARPLEIRFLSSASTRKELVRRVFKNPRLTGPTVASPPPPSFSPPSCNTPAAYHETLALGRWWLDRMRTSTFVGRAGIAPHPLREKMALFWHGLLVSSQRKGLVYCHHETLWRQNQIFRRLAVGRFRHLLAETATSPAMIYYLDNYANTVTNPNENFARELLELFSLGVGHFSQADVAAAARACTGHTVSDNRLEPRFFQPFHDDGQKTFLGVTANWDMVGASSAADTRDLIAHIADPRRGEGMTVARTLARLLWEYFAYFGPDAALVDEIAVAATRSGQLQIGPLLFAIFSHDEFWSPRAREGKVRNPVEWTVSMLRGLGIPPVFLANLGWDATQLPMSDMGLQLFHQPNVFGWWRRPEDHWVHAPGFQAKALSAAVMAQTVIQAGAGLPWFWLGGSSAQAVDAAFLACNSEAPPPGSPVRERGIQLLDQVRALGGGADAQLVHLLRYVALSPTLQAN